MCRHGRTLSLRVPTTPRMISRGADAVVISLKRAFCLGFVVGTVVLAMPAAAQNPAHVVDLAETSTDTDFFRGLGSTGNGAFGVPVSGGHDIDGDGLPDTAFAAMTAGALGRSGNGLIFLVAGDGTISGTVNTGTQQSRILPIAGAQAAEHAGSELWVDDVTGDGTGDLLICRQDYDALGRSGAGALTILEGGSEIKTVAATQAGAAGTGFARTAP